MDPITAIGVAGSAVGIAGFGLQIATVLQTYIEASLEADDRIREIANDINATASALQRLQAVIDEDEKLAEGRVFNVEGLKSVNRISLQCDAVFKRTVELLNKAGRPGAELCNSKRAKDLKLHTLDHLKWPWLEPKILRCRQELERLLLKMLLMLQISSLAHQQRSVIERRPDDFAKERELRDVVARLSLREQHLTRQIERARLQERRITFKPDVEDELPSSEEAAVRETVVIEDGQMKSIATNDASALSQALLEAPDRGLDPIASFGIVQAPSQQLTSVLDRRREFGDTIVVDEDIKEIDLLASEKSRKKATSNSNQSPLASYSSSLHTRHEPNIEFGNLMSGPIGSSTNLPQRPRPNSQWPSPRDSHRIRPSQSPQVPPQSREITNQRLEAYLIKDGQGQALKMPLEQSELQNQLEAVLSRSKKSPWDVLVSLGSKEQGSINSVVELGRSKDGCERLLAAIEIQEQMEKIERHMWQRKKERKAVQHILLFLKLGLDNEKEKEYKRRLEEDLRKSGMNDQQIALVLKKDKAVDTNSSMWTRMSRRHLSIETLNHYRIDYEFDTDPDYVLVKRWVPEYEQDILWNHTREIREKRKPVLMKIEEKKHHRHESEFEVVRKRKHEKKRTPSPLITFLAGGTKSGERRFDSDNAEDYEFAKGKMETPFEPDAKVDDLLAKWTTAFGETATGDEEPDSGPLVGAEDGDDFLECTKLDDYFSDDEVSPGSYFSSEFSDD